MRLIKIKLFFLIFIIMFTGCIKYKESYNPLQEADKDTIKYDVKMFEVQDNSSLAISLNYGTLEIYGWRESKIKIEINNEVDNINSSNYDCYFNENKVVFNSKKHDEEENIKKSINLKIYIPRRISNLDINLKKCNFILYDRVNTNINLNIEDGDMIIKSFEGEINAFIKKGNITFDNVFLKGENNVTTQKGNISFRGSIVSNDISLFYTHFGNIKFNIYSSETAPLFECHGVIESNNLLYKKNSVSDIDSKVIIKCNIGHIDLAEIY